MCSTLPSQWHPTVVAAGPVLYQCIQRLGQFPFHNTIDAKLPGHALTLHVLTVALCILLGRTSHLGAIGTASAQQQTLRPTKKTWGMAWEKAWEKTR
jgi:hypothetical protein